MSEVKVRLRSVLSHEHLAVLERTHGSRVYVDIRVQLLRSYLQASRLQQAPEGRRRDPLAKSGHHTAGYKNVFRHGKSPFLCFF